MLLRDVARIGARRSLMIWRSKACGIIPTPVDGRIYKHNSRPSACVRLIGLTVWLPTRIWQGMMYILINLSCTGYYQTPRTVRSGRRTARRLLRTEVILRGRWRVVHSCAARGDVPCCAGFIRVPGTGTSTRTGIQQDMHFGYPLIRVDDDYYRAIICDI